MGPGFAAVCRARLAAGVARYRAKLWTGTHHRLCAEPETGLASDAVLGNQLVAQSCAGGLEPILPEPECSQATATIERFNVAATPAGAVNSMLPGGGRDPAGGANFAPNIFVGEVTAAACGWMYQGRRDLGELVVTRLHEALVRHRCLWDEHCLISAEDGAQMWGREYYSDTIPWAIPMARAGQGLAAFAGKGGLVQRVIAAGAWGQWGGPSQCRPPRLHGPC